MIKILDFYADWCGPCKMMDPMMKEVLRDHPDVELEKVNVDQNEKLTEEYGVKSIPTLVFFKNGKEVERLNGFASTSAIENVLKRI